MKICEYGCGREAKYPPRKGKGKWSCENNWQNCPAKRKDHSIRIKKLREDKDSVFNSILYRVKQSKALKKAHKDLNSIFNSILYRENLSNIMKEVWKDPDSGFNSDLCREKKSKAQKLTIEKIQEKYKTFYSEEEMRYNPDKLEEKEIQVHCNNHLCPNSKEKDGWFTPTYIQLYERRRQLEHLEGNDGSFFYCSQECKDTCPCYRLMSDPLQLAEYQQYHRKVQKFTYLNLKYNYNKIRDIELRGKKYSYDLDHKFSILDGFNNDIDPKIIGHWRNLEVIKASDNRTKRMNSSISIEEIQKIGELFDIYKKFY